MAKVTVLAALNCRARNRCSGSIGSGDERYRTPLERDVEALAAALPEHGRVVLLGSVATGKYVELLARLLGARLHYPPAFIGRGDMSRGGLLLRHAREGTELEYRVLHRDAPRHGPRPPRLDGRPSRAASVAPVRKIRLARASKTRRTRRKSTRVQD